MENCHLKLYLVIVFTFVITAGVFLHVNRNPSHETPQVTKTPCSKCESKVDTGDEYICCSDCSYPRTFSYHPDLGYCESGAKILVEPRPKEIYKWVLGEWKPCSSLCDGGIRQRDVECYSVFENTWIPDYPVYDQKCSSEEMPAREEACNLQSCLELMDGGSQQERKHNRISRWKIGPFIVLGIAAVGGVAYVGFIQYKRYITPNPGHKCLFD